MQLSVGTQWRPQRVPVQNLREVGFIPVYSEIQVRVVIKKRLQNGGLEQVALMFESSKGRLTLDSKILPTPLSPLPSLRLAEALSGSLSKNLLHRRLGHSGEAALQRLCKETWLSVSASS